MTFLLFVLGLIVFFAWLDPEATGRWVARARNGYDAARRPIAERQP